MMNNNIAKELNKCIQCKNPSCMKGCPLHNNIPLIIKSLKEGDAFTATVELSNSVFSEVCARVCYGYCMDSCNLKKIGREPNIRDIEKYVFDNFEFVTKEKVKGNNLKVCVIGAGVSGLSCAYKLALSGAKVDIFEKNDYLGGLARYAIPNFRLDNDILDKCIKRVTSLGVNIYLNQLVTLEKLDDFLKQYDYIYLAAGANSQVKPRIENLDANISMNSHEFLYEINRNSNYSLVKDKRVLVLGGGNVALDCAVSSATYGAKEVKIVYRRRIVDMPARRDELGAALEKNVQILELTNPISIRENSVVVGRMEAGPIGDDGRATFIPTKNTYSLDADLFIYAAGSYPDHKEFDDIIENNKGRIIVKDDKQTNVKKIYAGGDIARGASSITLAIADGYAAAEAIIKGAK